MGIIDWCIIGGHIALIICNIIIFVTVLINSRSVKRMLERHSMNKENSNKENVNDIC